MIFYGTKELKKEMLHNYVKELACLADIHCKHDSDDVYSDILNILLYWLCFLVTTVDSSEKSTPVEKTACTLYMVRCPTLWSAKNMYKVEIFWKDLNPYFNTCMHPCRGPEQSSSRQHWIWWSEVWSACPGAEPGHSVGTMLSLMKCLCRYVHNSNCSNTGKW